MYCLIGLIITGAIIWVVWRLSSRRWELPCPSWLGWLVEMDNPFTKTNRASSIVELLELGPGLKALDVGCGPGRLAIPLAKRIGPLGEVTAMDMQAGMLEKVKGKAAIAGLGNITLLLGKIGEGRLGIDQYDRALLVTVLGEIPDQKQALKEIFNSLKPGGSLLIAEVIFDPHFQRQRKVLPLAKTAGFQVKKIIGNILAYNILLQKPE